MQMKLQSDRRVRAEEAAKLLQRRLADVEQAKLAAEHKCQYWQLQHDGIERTLASSHRRQAEELAHVRRAAEEEKERSDKENQRLKLALAEATQVGPGRGPGLRNGYKSFPLVVGGRTPVPCGAPED